jgi:hypothetical protein
MDDLRFANGVQLTPEKDAVIVAELTMARLIKYDLIGLRVNRPHVVRFGRYHLKGERKGQREVLANLPGFPDNIRLSDHKTYLVAFAMVRFPNSFYSSLMDALGEYPWIRRAIASVSRPTWAPRLPQAMEKCSNFYQDFRYAQDCE